MIAYSKIYLKMKTQGYTDSESLIRKFIADFRSELLKEKRL